MLENTQYCGLINMAEGTGGDLPLTPGVYYLRVISTSSLSNFNISNIGTYKLSIEPVGKIDEVEITDIKGYNRTYIENAYPQGNHVRIDEARPTYMGVEGCAYYIDNNGVRHPSPNARVTGIVINNEWLNMYRDDMAYTNGNSVANNSGFFKMTIPVLSGVGANSYVINGRVHRYDVMTVVVYSGYSMDVKDSEDFYLLKNSFKN